jgi:hypothetical protein
MKLSEVIKNLNKAKKQYGNLDCVYSIDDEGNDFQRIHFTPTPMRKNENDNWENEQKIPTHICVN